MPVPFLLFVAIDGTCPGIQGLGQTWHNLHPDRGVGSSHERATAMRQRIRYDHEQPILRNEFERSVPVPDRKPEARDLARIGCLIEAAALMIVSAIFVISQALSAGAW